MQSPGDENTFYVKITSNFSIHFEGKCNSAQIQSKEGDIELLPFHQDIYHSAHNVKINLTNASGSNTFSFETAIIEMQDNKATIFVR